MRRAVWILLLVGCGRARFDELFDGSVIDAPPGDATMITLGAADGVVQDTYIAECAATLEFGSADHLHAGSSAGTCTVNALLRFDTSSLAPGTVVLGATLHLWTHTNNMSTGLHTLYPILEPWVEGISSDTGTVGAPNWTENSTGDTWLTTGCGVGSRSATSMGSFSPAMGTAQPIVAPLDVSVVQGWLDAPATNFGMAIENIDATVSSLLRSREHPEVATTPKLVVTVQF